MSQILETQQGIMDYVAFGKGRESLVIIPGLSDGLSTVKGKGFLLKGYYKKFCDRYRIHIFSRSRSTRAGDTTAVMAQDLAEAMKQLGLQGVDLVGISMGGMIAQHLAAQYPDLVERLVLAVTAARPNPLLEENIGSWLTMTAEGRYWDLMRDTIEKSYSEKYLKKYRRAYPLLRRTLKVKEPERFMIQASACGGHDALALLSRIERPVLVIAGAQDRILGGGASDEIVEAIPGAELFTYQEYGHGVVEERKQDFNLRIKEFLMEH